MTVKELIFRLQNEFPDECEVKLEVPDKDVFLAELQGVTEDVEDGVTYCVLTTEPA